MKNILSVLLLSAALSPFGAYAMTRIPAGQTAGNPQQPSSTQGQGPKKTQSKHTRSGTSSSQQTGR